MVSRFVLFILQIIPICKKKFTEKKFRQILFSKQLNNAKGQSQHFNLDILTAAANLYCLSSVDLFRL